MTTTEKNGRHLRRAVGFVLVGMIISLGIIYGTSLLTPSSSPQTAKTIYVAVPCVNFGAFCAPNKAVKTVITVTNGSQIVEKVIKSVTVINSTIYLGFADGSKENISANLFDYHQLTIGATIALHQTWTQTFTSYVTTVPFTFAKNATKAYGDCGVWKTDFGLAVERNYPPWGYSCSIGNFPVGTKLNSQVHKVWANIGIEVLKP